MSQPVITEIENSYNFAAALDLAIDGLTFERNDRIRSSCACLRLARDHHFAIIKLLEFDACASAFALARVQYEALVRGTWLRDCATANDVQSFQKCVHKKLDKMVREVKSKGVPWAHELGALHLAAIGGLSDYVHSCWRAASRQLSVDTIEVTYTESEIIEVITFADVFGYHAAIGIAQLAGSEMIQEQLSLTAAKHLGIPI